RKISRILSNEISIRILKLLDRKSMSASDIADELGVRLNTLKYNLDSLLEVELIRVRQVKWSRKGREIKVYETVGKTIILLSGKKNSDMSLILTLLRHYNLKSPEKKDTSEISGLCCEHGI
ncbi:MAG: helix-turn-helix domain-containing protein, partial [Methanosarcina sp.]